MNQKVIQTTEIIWINTKIMEICPKLLLKNKTSTITTTDTITIITITDTVTTTETNTTIPTSSTNQINPLITISTTMDSTVPIPLTNPIKMICLTQSTVPII